MSLEVCEVKEEEEDDLSKVCREALSMMSWLHKVKSHLSLRSATQD